MKIYSRQYMIRSYNNVNTSCYNKISLKLRDGNSRYIVLIRYDNIVDSCQSIKYNLQDTFYFNLLSRNFKMLLCNFILQSRKNVTKYFSYLNLLRFRTIKYIGL